MLGTVIFYTALLSSVVSINGLRDKELVAVLKLLDHHFGNGKSSTSEESSGDIDANNLVGQKLKAIDVINLIQQAKQNKRTVQDYNSGSRYKSKYDTLNEFYPNNQYDSNRVDKDDYETRNIILEKFWKGESQDRLKKKRLIPNRLLSANQYKYENEVREPKTGLKDYSRIFVILDPIALQKSRNTENLQNLLSRIILKTSSSFDNSRQDRSEAQHRYKGFIIKDNTESRRSRRESKETYSGGGGDDDDDYRPKKRPKKDHGGGGSGRTAIPYIRHRGDIYEREH